MRKTVLLAAVLLGLLGQGAIAAPAEWQTQERDKFIGAVRSSLLYKPDPKKLAAIHDAVSLLDAMSGWERDMMYRHNKERCALISSSGLKDFDEFELDNADLASLPPGREKRAMEAIKTTEWIVRKLKMDCN